MRPTSLPAWLAAAVVTAAPGVDTQNGQAINQPALTPNKQLIIDFFGFSGPRDVRAERFLAPDYIQHNPRFLRMDEITGARGNQAWVKAGEEANRRGIQLVALGGIPLRNPIIVLHEGDLAHAVYRGTRPDPAAPDTMREVFAFESFRIRDGKFTEHWDQVRLAPGWMMGTPPQPGRGGQPQAAGAVSAILATPPRPAPDCVANPAQHAAHKRVVLSLFDRSIPPDTRRARLATDFVEHSPRNLARGLAAGTVARRPGVDHILAECDYVGVVWKETLPDPDRPGRTWEAFTFDTFRVRNGQVVEHWDDAQI